MSAVAIVAHALFDLALGWMLLSWSRRRLMAVHLPAALLLGIYADTLLVGTLVFAGMPLPVASGILVGAAAVGAGIAWRHQLLQGPVIAWERPRWYEWLVLLSVAEKAAFALWQLLRTPVYFDDALTHWAGRARALYGGVNWSLDPQSPVWLGYDPHARHYPLLTVVWRAETAVASGGWDDLLARADGMIFFGTVVATVWLAVLQFSQARWLAASAAFVVAALPLQAWHAAAGYSDIAVEAYAVAALAALLRREWLLAGVLAAGSGWAKNDGLVLFMPPLLLGACVMRERWRDVARFVAGCATLAPWLIIKAWLALGIAPNQDRLAWHGDTLWLMLTTVVLGPTSSIFWLSIGAMLLLARRSTWGERTGRGLLVALAAMTVAVLFVYGCTEAHVWLVNEGTIHRTMLQLSASATVIALYGYRSGTCSCSRLSRLE